MHSPTKPYRTLNPPTADLDLGPAFDEALDRLTELSRRLGQVRAVHRPSRRRWARSRCVGCGQPHPCMTVLATGPAGSR